MTDDSEREPVEVLAEDFLARRRRGEAVSVADFAARHPDLAGKIAELFPMLVEIEDIKSQRERAVQAATPSVPKALRQLGDFRIVREIGRGGMGIVYEAVQQSLGRRVAVKVLLRHASLDEKQLRRFQREARTAAQLHHTNIVPVFGVGEENGLHYFVMQYIAGVGLDSVLVQLRASAQAAAGATASSPDSGPLARAVEALLCGDFSTPRRPGSTSDSYFRSIARIGVQAADALQYAHAQGVLHRDIKPANLLLDAQGTVWVADFGLARAIDHTDVSRTGDVVGTLRYMPPEQFHGQVDARSDVYSLGLTLYELATLRPAYDDSHPSRLIQQVTQTEPAPPRSIAPRIPRDLETIILKAAAREPERRYQTAGQLCEDLQRFLDDRPIQARRISAVQRLWRWCRRNPALAAASGLALGGLLLAAIIGWIGYASTRAALVEKEAEHQAVLAAHARTEATLDVALAGFDRVFVGLAGSAAGVSLDNGDGEPITLPVVSEQDARVLQELLAFYDRFAELNRANPKLRRELAEANRRVGEIQQRLGRLTDAEVAYRRALEAVTSLAERDDSRDVLAEQAGIHVELGGTLLLLSRFDEARGELEQAIAARRQLVGQSPDDLQAKFDLACALEQLGGLSRLPRLAERGEPALREAAKLLEALVQQQPNRADYRLALARTLRLLSPIMMRAGQREESLAAINRTLSLLEALHGENPAQPEYLTELVETNLTLNLDSPLVRLPVARRRFEQAVLYAEELSRQHRDVPAYTALRSRASARLGEVLQRQGDAPGACRELAAARVLLDDLIRRFSPVPIYRLQRGELLLTLGAALRDDVRLADSRAALETALQDLDIYLQAVPRSFVARNRQAQTYRSLAATLERLGEATSAREAAAKAEQLRSLP